VRVPVLSYFFLRVDIEVLVGVDRDQHLSDVRLQQTVYSEIVTVRITNLFHTFAERIMVTMDEVRGLRFSRQHIFSAYCIYKSGKNYRRFGGVCCLLLQDQSDRNVVSDGLYRSTTQPSVTNCNWSRLYWREQYVMTEWLSIQVTPKLMLLPLACGVFR
jgi:hypothetical protein